MRRAASSQHGQSPRPARRSATTAARSKVRGRSMRHDTTAAAVPSIHVDPKDGSGQRPTALALLAMVVLLDQTTKWWGWRHGSGAIINPGADLLVGRTVGSWYAG